MSLRKGTGPARGWRARPVRSVVALDLLFQVFSGYRITYTGHSAGSGGTVFARATLAKKPALAFGTRFWVAKST